mmetsp:Transcript_58389/g.173777  ORF Transcript_58389/g.173777 Transcript_58389/m.173777 type:complete len:276 (+) Transcript_58389:685-1512(+)
MRANLPRSVERARAEGPVNATAVRERRGARGVLAAELLQAVREAAGGASAAGAGLGPGLAQLRETKVRGWPKLLRRVRVAAAVDLPAKAHAEMDAHPGPEKLVARLGVAGLGVLGRLAAHGREVLRRGLPGEGGIRALAAREARPDLGDLRDLRDVRGDGDRVGDRALEREGEVGAFVQERHSIAFRGPAVGQPPVPGLVSGRGSLRPAVLAWVPPELGLVVGILAVWLRAVAAENHRPAKLRARQVWQGLLLSGGMHELAGRSLCAVLRRVEHA